MINITIDINGSTIIRLGARRIKPLMPPPKTGQRCTYVVTNERGESQTELGKITHPFGIGQANALAIKVLEKFGSQL